MLEAVLIMNSVMVRPCMERRAYMRSPRLIDFLGVFKICFTMQNYPIPLPTVCSQILNYVKSILIYAR